jgi:hypothetical protein
MYVKSLSVDVLTVKYIGYGQRKIKLAAGSCQVDPAKTTNSQLTRNHGRLTRSAMLHKLSKGYATYRLH